MQRLTGESHSYRLRTEKRVLFCQQMEDMQDGGELSLRIIVPQGVSSIKTDVPKTVHCFKNKKFNINVTPYYFICIFLKKEEKAQILPLITPLTDGNVCSSSSHCWLVGTAALFHWEIWTDNKRLHCCVDGRTSITAVSRGITYGDTRMMYTMNSRSAERHGNQVVQWMQIGLVGEGKWVSLNDAATNNYHANSLMNIASRAGRSRVAVNIEILCEPLHPSWAQ